MSKVTRPVHLKLAFGAREDEFNIALRHNRELGKDRIKRSKTIIRNTKPRRRSFRISKDSKLTNIIHNAKMVIR
jgi:hypothetical protein